MLNSCPWCHNEDAIFNDYHNPLAYNSWLPLTADLQIDVVDFELVHALPALLYKH